MVRCSQRVQVPNNLVFGFRVIVILVQVLGKYMITRYLDPLGLGFKGSGAGWVSQTWDGLGSGFQVFWLWNSGFGA